MNKDSKSFNKKYSEENLTNFIYFKDYLMALNKLNPASKVKYNAKISS